MTVILIVMLWEISLVLAFTGGFLCRKRKRPIAQDTPLTEEEKKVFRRIKKEQENFMTYDGTPQNAINDYE